MIYLCIIILNPHPLTISVQCVRNQNSIKTISILAHAWMTQTVSLSFLPVYSFYSPIVFSILNKKHKKIYEEMCPHASGRRFMVWNIRRIVHIFGLLWKLCLLHTIYSLLIHQILRMWPMAIDRKWNGRSFYPKTKQSTTSYRITCMHVLSWTLAAINSFWINTTHTHGKSYVLHSPKICTKAPSYMSVSGKLIIIIR